MTGWRIKVPGKIMLAGEYSVLHGGKALAATIDAYLTATITDSQQAVLNSNLWSKSKTFAHLGELDQRDPYEMSWTINNSFPFACQSNQS